MNDRTTLVLVPPEGARGVAPETVLLGLPIIRRTALAAKRAGFQRVVVVDATPEIRAALEGTDAELAAVAPAEAVRLPWNVAVQTKDLKPLRAGAPSAGVPILSRSDLPRAEAFLLRGLIKDTEGFLSRHFDRKISLAISRRLVGTRVTPNQMTVVSVAIGVFGALFFLSVKPVMETLGALCFVLHSIVDGCDGELARLKFQESRRGGLLDFWGDNLVHVAVFSAMAVGWSHDIGKPWPLWVGAAAILGDLLSAGFVHWQTMTRAQSKDGPLFTTVSKRASRISRVADDLSRRDFIYLILILSLFGKAHWFLVMAAVGAPMFFLALVAIAIVEWRSSRSSS